MAKTQRDAVIEVMRAHNGHATLGYLYQHVLDVPGVEWRTKTPFASMRRIVQTNPEFFKVRPGLWALEEYREKLKFADEVGEDAPAEAQETFNHSYFQGLLVEMGNFQRFATYVPPQDKNGLFVDRPLSTLTTVKTLYPFSYESITKFAKTVDVVWFNERKMPSAFIEVEHSTDMYNSLRKFAELQDFNAGFAIVAPDARKAEFENKRDSTPYEDVRERVEFWGYEDVAELHGYFAGLASKQRHGLSRSAIARRL